MEQPDKAQRNRKEVEEVGEEVVLKIVKNPFHMDDSAHNGIKKSTSSSTSRIATDPEPSTVAAGPSSWLISSTTQDTSTSSTVLPADNAWLAPAPRSSKKQTSENRINKIQAKRKRDELENVDDGVDIDTSIDRINETLGAAQAELEDEDAPSMTYGRGKIAFKQNELLQRAFAADAFEQDFMAEKEAVIAEDAPKEEDLTLPGWGIWTGQGVKRRATEKKLVKKIPGIEESKRKDAKLKNVIINEKRVKNVHPH
jgi:U3 small nucleolar RNA-associated protein 14